MRYLPRISTISSLSMIQIWGQSFSYLEITGTVFGIAGVWLTVKENIWCFPVGIVNVASYAFLFLQSKLYVDAILQVIYIMLLIYGWYKWISGRNNSAVLPVTRTSFYLMVSLSILCIAATFTIG